MSLSHAWKEQLSRVPFPTLDVYRRQGDIYWVCSSECKLQDCLALEELASYVSPLVQDQQ